MNELFSPASLAYRSFIGKEFHCYFLKNIFLISFFSFDSAENEELTLLLIREVRGVNDGEKFKESQIRGQFF